MNPKKNITEKTKEEQVESALTFFIAVLTAIDIRIYIARILKKRNIILLILVPLICLSLAIIAAKTLIISKWTATCVLYRNTKAMKAQKDMPDIYVPIDVDTVIQTIRTRNNIKKVIKELNLDIPIIVLNSKINISKHKNKSIITISVTDENRFTAADIANTLANVFLDSYIKLLRSSTIEIHDYYEKSGVKIQNKIDALENKLRLYLSANKVISIKGETDSKLEQLNGIELKILENKMLKSAMAIRLRDINNEVLGLKDKVPITYLISSGGKSLGLKERQLSVLRQKYTDLNPKVLRIISEIEKMKEEDNKRKSSAPVPEQITYGDNILKQNLTIERSNVKSKLLAIEINIKNLKAGLLNVNERLVHLSKHESIQSQLQRKIDLNQELLQNVKQVLSITEIVSKSSVIDIKILEEAVPPSYPKSSMRKVIAVAGGIIGLILILIFVLLPEFLDFRVKSDAEIKRLLGIKSSVMLPNKDFISDTVFYEALQIFLEGMISPSVDTVPITVFCSSVDDVGKSFAISCLNEVLVKKNKRVLYIDSVYDVTDDIKDSVINNYLYDNKTENRDYKTNKISENIHKLYFEMDIETYKFPLDKKRLISFLEEQKKTVDYIIIELFPFNKNRQLFSTFTSVANTTVLVSGFRTSGKFHDKTLVDFIRKYDCSEIFSLVNNIDNHYYKYLI